MLVWKDFSLSPTNQPLKSLVHLLIGFYMKYIDIILKNKNKTKLIRNGTEACRQVINYLETIR